MKESYLKNRSNVFEVPVKWIVFLRIFLPIDIVINVLLLIIPIVYSTFSYLNIALDVAVIVINIVQAIAVYRLSQKDYKRLMISWGVMPFIYIIRYLVYSLSINKRLYAADYRIIVVGFIFFILYSWANQVYFRNRKVLFYLDKYIYLSDEAKAVVLCTGTYLKARCLCGEAITHTGPNGLQPANYLTDSLLSSGISETVRSLNDCPGTLNRIIET